MIGALTAIAGIGYLIDAFGTFLADYSLNVAMFTFIGELVLMAWLLLQARTRPSKDLRAASGSASKGDFPQLRRVEGLGDDFAHPGFAGVASRLGILITVMTRSLPDGDDILLDAASVEPGNFDSRRATVARALPSVRDCAKQLDGGVPRP